MIGKVFIVWLLLGWMGDGFGRVLSKLGVDSSGDEVEESGLPGEGMPYHIDDISAARARAICARRLSPNFRDPKRPYAGTDKAYLDDKGQSSSED